jgi:hypothetical protein
MDDMNYEMVKNKVIKPMKKVAGETGPELSSDEELRPFTFDRKLCIF